VHAKHKGRREFAGLFFKKITLTCPYAFLYYQKKFCRGKIRQMKKTLRHTGIAAILAMTCANDAIAGTWDKVENPWQVRVRGIGVVPDESGSIFPIGGDVAIDDAYAPELDITYFFTKHIATELILATANHEVDGNNTSLGNVDLGDVWILPPTLTLQYHFTPDNRWSPYAGAGINYTVFYNEDSGAVNDIEYDNEFGYVLQAGIDYKLDEHWLLNADVKKLFLETDVSVNNGAITSEVDIDPWIIGLGVGYRF
jgi:outer membrane protein